MNKNKPVILLAEDYPEMRKGVVTFLKHFDFEVLSAENGKLALKLFEDNKDKIVLVITDYRMPEMNGIQLGNAIKKLDSDVFIILYTSDFLDKLPLESFNEVYDKSDSMKMLKSIAERKEFFTSKK